MILMQDFTLQESDDHRSIVLTVQIGKYMDTSLIETDVQPLLIRMLIKVSMSIVFCVARFIAIRERRVFMCIQW